MSQAIRRISAVIVGLVFVFSAVSKLTDPVGTGLIVEEYFKLFHLDFLIPASKATGEILSLMEGIAGIGLVCGAYRRCFAIASWCLMAFFTVVSIILLILNPEMDCGCFGKALTLTHAQTFWKNVILDILCAIAFIPLYSIGQSKTHRKVSFWIALAFFAAFTVVSNIQTPFYEFTDYRASNVVVPEGKYPESWKEYTVLPLWSDSGEDCSSSLTTGSVAVISIYDTGKLTQSDISRIATFAQDAANAGYEPVLLSAGQIEIPGLETFFADYKTLMTFNRSNGGVTYLDNGYIICKRSIHEYMSFEHMEQMIQKDPTEAYLDEVTRHSVISQGILLAGLALLLII